MSTIATWSSELTSLVDRLDRAAEQESVEPLCEGVKRALTGIIESSNDFLPESLLEPEPEGYARRLVHRDPEGRYSVLAMVWGPGQGTPLHDHAGVWCVECVYRGRIRVVSYDREGEPEDGLYRFAEMERVIAERGAAGALIPPFEYHTIDNPHAETAVTLHVYAGEMTWCHTFTPQGDGTYRRERRELAYTE